MNISDWQHKQNRKTMADLRAKGFTFKVNANGYQVWLNGEYVTGAGVILPRQKALHWRHAQANIRDNLHCAIIAAQRKQGEQNA
jgi:hypothetical protein